MDFENLKALFLYYIREKYYNSALTIAKEGIVKYKREPLFPLFHALALILNNHVEEGLHFFELIKSESEIKLSALIAIMYANKLLGVADEEVFASLDVEMKNIRKIAEPVDFYYSGLILFSLHKLEKSLDYLNKALTLQMDLHDACTLKGWVLLELKKSGNSSKEKISNIFLESQHTLDSQFGLVEAYIYENNYDEANIVASNVLIKFPNLELPYILKIRVQLALQGWDNIDEILNKMFSLNPNSLEALKTTIMIMLCRDSNFEDAILFIKKYISVFLKVEPNNGKMLLDISRFFSQISARNHGVLTETYTMIEQHAKQFSGSSEFACELGFQCLQRNNVKDALRFFNTALNIDNSSMYALMGSIFAELKLMKDMEEVKIKVDVLFHMKGVENSPMALLLKAKCCENEDDALFHLNKASNHTLNLLKDYPYSENFIKLLNPDLMMEIVHEYLKHINFAIDFTLHLKSSVPTNPVNSVASLLAIIHKACPGMVQPLLLLAKIQYLMLNDINNATVNVENILSRENVPSEAFILMAHIQLRNGRYEIALQSLEEGLSVDFKLRENPVFHFINGIVQKKLSSFHDSIKSFTTALSLLNENDKKTTDISCCYNNFNDRGAILVELVDAHNQIGQTDEAGKLLGEATEILQKPEESRIILLHVDQALNRKNIHKALELLEKLDPSDIYYTQGRIKFANILLEYRKDKQAYLKCYLDMVDENPCVDTFMLLGEAYMTVLEPDLAIETYNKALEENPRDPYINLKLGGTLEFAHYFQRAIDFYKEAIELTNDIEMKIKLGNLYMQMNEFTKAEHLLMSEIEEGTFHEVDDLTFLRCKTKLLNLLATVQSKSGNMAGAFITLKDAKDNQYRVRKRLDRDLPSVPQNEINILVDIYMKLAEICVHNGENDKAIGFFKEACEEDSNNLYILGALAKLFMQTNSLELCQQTCASILNIDKENEEASLIMADIAFYKVDFEMARFHFTQLLTRQPTNWNAMSRLVEISRRTGTLEDVPQYLCNAEIISDYVSKDAGFLYSKALYQWYTGNLNGALRNFNIARQDLNWGLQAISNMIEICLNPEDDMLMNQFVENEDSEYQDSRTMALKTADRLLKDLNQKLNESGDMLQYELLSNFRLLATKEKLFIEQALECFITLSSRHAYKDNIGITLGIATAYMLQKQYQRAKNLLKRVAKSTWTFQDAEHLEKCWLLLAEYYIQSGKHEVANDLLSRVMEYNKSSKKAYEYLGLISEKEQKYRDAAANYELAFKYGGRNNASIGYKLAFCSMKSKNYPDAIYIAQQVVRMNPEYALRIKKDILDKSISNLRI